MALVLHVSDPSFLCLKPRQESFFGFFTVSFWKPGLNLLGGHGLLLLGLVCPGCFCLGRTPFVLQKCSLRLLWMGFFRESAVEGLVGATLGPLWWMCCGVGYSGPTLVDLLWKG